jgi:hypothetical protein
MRLISKMSVLLASLCLTLAALGSYTEKATQHTWRSVSTSAPCEPVSTQLQGALGEQTHPERRVAGESYPALTRNATGGIDHGSNSEALAPGSELVPSPSDIPASLRQRPPPRS